MSVLIFSAVLYEKFLILRRMHRHNGQKLVLVYSARYSCPLFHETWIFSIDFSKNTQKNLIKIPVVGAKYFHADGRTDMTKLIVAFRNFAKAPIKIS